MKTLIALALAATLSATPAAAQPAAGTDVVRAVRTADLDLAREHGRDLLDRRIRAAVNDACGQASSADPAGRRTLRACRADALARVAPQRDRALAAARQAAPTTLAAQR